MTRDLRFQLDLPLEDNQRFSLVHFGFRVGEKGTHTSRTIMLEEITALLAAVPAEAQPEDYATCAVEDNCLGKKTLATRKLTLQRLRELYALDPETSLFRIFRTLWDVDEFSLPQLALMMGLARDPLLRITMPSVINTTVGGDFSRTTMANDLEARLQGRLNQSVLDKVVRNAASSWTQSGHLKGRAHKVRMQLRPTAVSATLALLLAFVLGRRGTQLLNNPWTSVLDVSEGEVKRVAEDAHRLGLLNMKGAGGFLDISFPNLLTEKDEDLIRGTH